MLDNEEVTDVRLGANLAAEAAECTEDRLQRVVASNCE